MYNPSNLKINFYELSSISYGFSLLILFGIFSYFPYEIMFFGEKQTYLMGILILSLFILGIYILLTFFRLYATLMLRISEFLSSFLVIIVFLSFIKFNGQLSEPWLVLNAWFLRYNGLVIGFFLGTVSMKTSSGIVLLLQNLKQNSLNNEKQEDSYNYKITTVITSKILISTSLFLIAFLVSLRYYSPLLMYFLIFSFQMIMMFYNLYENRDKHVQSTLIQHNSQENDNINENDNLNQKNRKMNWKRNVNFHITKNGGNPAEFWPLFYTFLISVIFFIIILVVYIQKVEVFILIPFMLYQILAYVLIAFIFFIIGDSFFQDRANRKLKPYGLRKINIYIIKFFDEMKFLGVFLYTFLLIYFFDYPIYMPEIVSSVILFGIIGCVCSYILTKLFKKYQTPIKILLYTISIITLMVNLIIVFNTSIAEAINVLDESFDIFFPFTYFHSWLWRFLTGFSLGLLLFDVAQDLLFNHTDDIASESPKKAVYLPYVLFIFGMISHLIFWFMNFPGGDPPLTDPTNNKFTILVILIECIMFLGYVYHLVLNYLLPYLLKKRNTRSALNSIESNETNQTKFKMEIRNLSRRKIYAISLIALVGISAFACISVPLTYQSSYSRPVIAYSPDQYYIWIQNSSERVTKNQPISLSASPKIDSFNISLAKNEYGALQLVWRPLNQKIKQLTYSISDFSHKDEPSSKITAGNCSLRRVENIIEDEFPDMLVPFSSIDLQQNENNILWFSIKTPYDTFEGIYSGQITFQYYTGWTIESLQININLNIWNFTIPRQRHLRTSIGAYWENTEKIENFANHRVSDYGTLMYCTLSRSEFETNSYYTCLLNETNQWEFRWDYWDAWTQYKLNMGMNAFNIPYPLGIHNDRVPIVVDEFQMQLYEEFLKQVVVHLKDKEWINYSYIYFIDEFQLFIPAGYTRQSYFEIIEEFARRIDQAAPEIKIMTTVPPTDELSFLFPYVDIFCPVGRDRNKEQWDDRLRNGIEMWFYMCVGPESPYPNSHLYNRLYEPRVLLWQAWLYNVHGFLYWSADASYHGRYGIAYNGYGDGWFTYNRNGQTIDSLRWENYLEGQEDYEYIWLINATLNYLEEHPGLIDSEEINSFRSLLNRLVNSVVGERWIYCDSASIIYESRDNIGSILSELSSIVNITEIGEKPWY